MTGISPLNSAEAAGFASAGSRPQWLTRRRLLVVGAATVIGSGMALNWGWITAIGLAPILITLAPCAAMCGLGLCMKGGSSKCCSKSPDAAPSD